MYVDILNGEKIVGTVCVDTKCLSNSSDVALLIWFDTRRVSQTAMLETVGMLGNNASLNVLEGECRVTVLNSRALTLQELLDQVAADLAAKIQKRPQERVCFGNTLRTYLAPKRPTSRFAVTNWSL
ncbi:hypothetical protein BH09PAT2_BH09PAT2_09820 [soil metagenome]